MSSRYSSCFSFTSPNIFSRSTCEKPMIAFSGVRSSCDMFARNSDLCRLAVSSSPVEAAELVVHPVHVGPERAQLVPVGNVDTAGEVAGLDRGQSRVDPLDRPDQRPGEDEAEQEREDDRPRCDADEQVPRARVRARVLGDHGIGFRRRFICELGREVVEVGCELLGPGTELKLVLPDAPRRSDVMMSCITVESCSLFARIPRRTLSSSARGTNPRLSARVAGRIRASALAIASSTRTAAPRPVGAETGLIL